MNFAMSFVGGGQRGLLGAIALADLEKQTGKLTRELVQYVAGTSTGALLAGAVAAGIPASTMVDLYTTKTKDVFKPSGVFSDVDMVARGHKYDVANLMKLLNEVFGTSVGWSVNDCPIGIMLAAVAANGHSWYFVRDNSFNAKTTGKVKLLEAMCASAAATTYFDAQRVAIPALEKSMWFFDGGVGGVANPSYEAALEMFVYDSFSPDVQRTHMLTVGTGFFPVAADSDVPPPKGLIAGIEFVTSTLVDASEDWVDRAVARQWPGLATKVDWKLPYDVAMDDLSAIPELTKIAQENPVDWKGLLSL